MTSLGVARSVGRAVDRRVMLWIAAVVALMTPLTLLTISINNNPFPSQDLSVLDSISGWDVAGLAGFFDTGAGARSGEGVHAWP